MGNKRPPSARSRWIWTGVLALPVIAIVVAGAYLSQQPLGRPPATPPPPALTDDRYTDFGKEGLAYATSARTVSVNASDLPIAASDIGLGDNETVTIPAADLGNKLRLTVGTDLVDLITPGPITVTATDGTVSSVIYTNGGSGIADVRTDLLADGDRFGLPESQVSDLVSTVRQLQRNGNGYSATLEPGTALGLAVTPSLECDDGGFCLLTHTVDLTP